METRTLGRTDLQVSAVCLGTMTFGLQTDRDEAFAQMDYALEHGVNFFDTAELYAVPPGPNTFGRTEQIIGDWLSDRGVRQKLILATKIAGQGPRWIRGGNNRIDRANMLAAVDGSLRRLRTDYIDLYQLHWPNRNSYHFGQLWTYAGGTGSNEIVRDNLIEVLRTAADLQQAGKIRHLGLCNETAWGVMRYLFTAAEQGEHLPRVVSVQNEFNLLNRAFEPDLAEIARREDVGLLAWSPLATGLLTGKYRHGARPEGSRWTLLDQKNHRDTPQAHRAVEAYWTVAQQFGIALPSLALAFVHSRPFVTSTIVGARTLDQLIANLSAFAKAPNDDVLQAISAVRRDFVLCY